MLAPTHSLTPRQAEVLRTWVACDDSRKATAAVLGISPSTVRAHLAECRRRLGATSTTKAALIAQRLGALDRDVAA